MPDESSLQEPSDLAPSAPAPASKSPAFRLDAHDEAPGNRVFACHFGDCRRTFDARHKLEAHSRIHTDERPYDCSLQGCNRAFKWRSSLAHHQRKHMRDHGARPEDFSPARKKSVGASSAPTTESLLEEFGNDLPRAKAPAQTKDDQQVGAAIVTLNTEPNGPGNLFYYERNGESGPIMRSLDLNVSLKETEFVEGEPSLDFNPLFEQ
mmetsp:Transcript_21870/g.54020  ORF Transcript_21870/g.54020 Transcript_21870/m.54020 type:complete len:208 (+) Transcript_21870:610-1233(+)|eukprot:CAMPEP_0174897206 /NCGR_PEP_ID=MMETSP0167-20121228/12203_1 /TAXON_ID=38298 /ORGANISM="Rhodella maculata, Strain CCMP736" /LENGTH=207 /DNA_ID=CAMNT_0016137029 /DNA_START=30 /DNA_END=653 /DNA_ORIENTATION=-